MGSVGSRVPGSTQHATQGVPQGVDNFYIPVSAIHPRNCIQLGSPVVQYTSTGSTLHLSMGHAATLNKVEQKLLFLPVNAILTYKVNNSCLGRIRKDHHPLSICDGLF